MKATTETSAERGAESAAARTGVVAAGPTAAGSAAAGGMRFVPLGADEVARFVPEREWCVEVLPADAAAMGRGMTFCCGCAATPFGSVGVLSAGDEIYRLSFVGAAGSIDYGDARACRSFGEFLEACRCAWPGAHLQHDDGPAERVVATLLDRTSPCRFRVRVVGSEFRLNVWRALARVPWGATVSYSTLAAMAGVPRAVRAAASAVASNDVGLLVPCHRVVRSDGSAGRFFWGPALKCTLLAWETWLQY